MRNSKTLVSIILTIILVIALDQLSKLLILDKFTPGEILVLIPDYFNLTLTFNRGAAFGLFADMPDLQRQIVLSATTLLALGVVLYLLLKDYSTDFRAQTALAMVIGGALGNIIDRVRLGQVVDFLDVYFGEYHWPAFNVADSCICVGVTYLVLRSLKKPSIPSVPN